MTTREQLTETAAANGWTDRTMVESIPTFERHGVRVSVTLNGAGNVHRATRRSSGAEEYLRPHTRGKREQVLAWLVETAAEAAQADASTDVELTDDPADIALVTATGTAIEFAEAGRRTLLARVVEYVDRPAPVVEVARPEGWVEATDDRTRVSFTAPLDPASVSVRQLAPDLLQVGDGRDPFARPLTVLRRGVGYGMAWMVKRDDDDLLAQPIRKRDDAVEHARRAYARWPHGVPAPVVRDEVVEQPAQPEQAAAEVSQNDEPARELPATLADTVRGVCSAPDCDEPLPPRAVTGRPRDTCSDRCRMRKSRAARRNPAARPQPWVIVPCGAEKLTHRAAAGLMYVGSYHAAARRAAAALTSPERTLILSARHGLLRLDDVIAPYDMTITHPESIAAEPKRLARQMRDLGIDGDVVALLPKAYAQTLRAAVRELNDPSNPAWRRPTRTRLDERLDGTRGIGEQLARFARIAGAAA
jgi:hypothetical protein